MWDLRWALLMGGACVVFGGGCSCASRDSGDDAGLVDALGVIGRGTGGDGVAAEGARGGSDPGLPPGSVQGTGGLLGETGGRGTGRSSSTGGTFGTGGADATGGASGGTFGLTGGTWGSGTGGVVIIGTGGTFGGL